MLRLFSIEARRTIALWLAPPLVLLACLRVSGTVQDQVFYWPTASETIAQVATLAGPLMAGAAAWMGARQRRHGLDDLLATAPGLPFAREIAAWLATVAWALLAYGAVGGYLALRAWRVADWGGPDLWMIGAGAVATLAYVAIGYALGRALPRRLTAPLIVIGTFTAQYFLAWAYGFGELPGRARYLSLAAARWPSVWFGTLPGIPTAQVLFYAGLAGFSLALLAWGLAGWRGVRPALATFLALALTASGVGYAVARTPEWHAPPLYLTTPLRPYEPICRAAPLPVCVHPSARARLPEITRQANLVLAPLVGLPGLPPRAEQTDYGWRTWEGAWPSDIIPFQEPTPERRLVLAMTVHALVELAVAPPSASGRSRRATGAQEAIIRWLWHQSGLTPSPGLIGDCDFRPEVCEAAERFARLDPTVRQSWLAANLIPLRAGTLRLEELP